MPLLIKIGPIGPPPNPIIAILADASPLLTFIGAVTAVTALAIAFVSDDPRRRRTVVTLAVVGSLLASTPIFFDAIATWMRFLAVGKPRLSNIDMCIRAIPGMVTIILGALAGLRVMKPHENHSA